MAAPALAVSLVTTSPAQPLPEAAPSKPVPLETWTAGGTQGSAALVPLMAADMQARRVAALDVPADAAGGAVAGKSMDDMAFVRQASDSGRKEISAARSALPQLKKPELKRLAETLVNDHSKSYARLAKLAESKGWNFAAPGPAEPMFGSRAGMLTTPIPTASTSASSSRGCRCAATT